MAWVWLVNTIDRWAENRIVVILCIFSLEFIEVHDMFDNFFDFVIQGFFFDFESDLLLNKIINTTMIGIILFLEVLR